VVGKDVVELVLDAEDLGGLDLDVARLTLGSAQRLVDHDAGVRQGIPFSRRAGRQEHGTHAGRLPDTDGADIGLDVLHGVVDRHAGRHDPARTVDVDRNVLFGILGFEEEELGDDQVGQVILDATTDENDAVLEEPGINVVCPFPATALLNDYWNQRHLGFPPCSTRLL
jgi:hypothetical protein